MYDAGPTLNKHWLNLLFPGVWFLLNEIDETRLPCKAKRQYLLTLQVRKYCLLALQSNGFLVWLLGIQDDADLLYNEDTSSLLGLAGGRVLL